MIFSFLVLLLADGPFGAKPKNNNSFQILEPAICVFVNPLSVYSVYCIVSTYVTYTNGVHCVCKQYIFRRRSTVPLNGNGRVEFPLLSVQLRGKAGRYFFFLSLFCPRQTRRGTMNSIADKKNLQSHCIKNWQISSWSRNEKKRSVTVKHQ